MNEYNKDRKPPHGRPASRPTGAKPYGRPAFGDKRPAGEHKQFGRPANGAPQTGGEPKQSGRPAPAVSRTQGERRPFSRPASDAPRAQDERKPYAPRPAYGAPRPQGERKQYGRPAPAATHAEGERKPISSPASDAPRTQEERKPYAPRPAYGAPRPQGERKPYAPRPASGAPKAQGERKLFGRPAPAPLHTVGDRMPQSSPVSDAPRQQGERKPYAPRPAYGAPRQQGERKPYAPRPAYGAPKAEGERKQYGRPAPAATHTEGERRPFSRPASDAPKAQGERKPYAPRSAFIAPRAQGERKPYAPRPAFGAPRAEGERKPYTPRSGFGGPRTDGEHKTFSRPSFGKPSFSGPLNSRAPFVKTPESRPAAPSLSSDARKSALQVLNRVLLEEGFASLSLNEHFNMVYLSPRDKRLCTNIVYLTLENLNKLDFALDRLLEDPGQLEARVRNLLRLSACQILLLDRVPDSAVVNEAVKITRDLGLEGLTGLVNGVLRNLIRQTGDIPWPAAEEGVRYYSIMFSYPQWLVEQILRDYGQETGHQILTYRRPSQSITIRPNLSRISEEAFLQMLEKKVWKHEKGQLPQAWHVFGVADIGRDSDYLEGNFSIQGEGSMVAAEAAFMKLGAQVLDACAAPGGKSAYLAERMQGTGRIHAWDVHEHRVELINALCQRLRLYNVRPALRDALVYREQLEGMMDVVLIDAPCTGSGVMDEKPDLKVRLSDQDLLSLAQTQRRLLDTCSRYVKPGGMLVYATCSILPDENSKQTEAFLLTHPEFTIQPLPETIPLSLRQHEGPLGLQLLPHRDSTEGFYIARMRRA